MDCNECNDSNKSNYAQFFELRNEFVVGESNSELSSGKEFITSETSEKTSFVEHVKTDYMSLIEQIKKDTIINYTEEQVNEHYESLKGEYEGKDSNRVKRPLNAFMLWSKLQRKHIQRKHKNLHNSEVSKILGSIWRTTEAKSKQIYQKVSEKLQAYMMSKYPDYKYRPVRRSGDSRKNVKNLCKLNNSTVNEILMNAQINRKIENFVQTYNQWSNQLLIKCLLKNDFNSFDIENLDDLNLNLMNLFPFNQNWAGRN